MLMLLINLCGFTVVPLQLCWCLARSSAGLRLASSACIFTSISHLFPKFCMPTQENFVFLVKMLRKPRSVAFAQKHFAKSLIKQQKIFPIWEKAQRLQVVMLLSSQMNILNVYYQASLRVKTGVNILQKDEDFVLGILGVLLGRIPGFYWNDHKILTILR